MAWCKVSSLTAAVSRTLKDASFPMSRVGVLRAVDGKNLEGWDVGYFLGQALKRQRYTDLRSVMAELEAWLEKQG